MVTILSNQLHIQAPVEIVWAVLSDFERYSEWNRFSPRVECTSQVGDPVTVYAQLAPNWPIYTTHLILYKLESPHTLCWGNDAWHLQVERCQTLTAQADGSTLYENRERFAGPLAPLLMAFLRRRLMAGYQLAAEGLKAQAEERTER